MVQATSSGELWVLGSDGDPVQSFNNGQPVTTDPYLATQSHGTGAGLPTPRETPRTPAIGDIDGDLESEIVLAAGEHVYAWKLDGSPVADFPVRLQPSLSEPCKPNVPKPCFDPGDRAITSSNHIKRGILGSPALADLDLDGGLDIVVTALDQHVHAWDGAGRADARVPAQALERRRRRRRDRDLAGDRGARRRPEARDRLVDERGGRRRPAVPEQPLPASERRPRSRDRRQPGVRDQPRRHRGAGLARRDRRRRRRPAPARAARPRRRGRQRRRRHRRGLGLGRDLAGGTGLQARERERRHGGHVRERGGQHPRPEPGAQPRRLHLDRERHRPAGRPLGGQGRPHRQRRGQPAGGQPEPSVHARRAGMGPVRGQLAGGAGRPGLPGRDRRLPAPLGGLDRARRRHRPGAPDPRRDRHVPAPRVRDRRHRARRVAEVHRRLDAADAGGRRRRRRRRPRRHRLHARGLVVPLGHRLRPRRRRLRRRRGRLRRLQRGVVDGPPRRARERQLRHRRPPARHARGPRRAAQRLDRDLHLDGARRRLDVRHRPTATA